MAAAPGYKTLPGFDSPAVGFESPFEMLEACHERVLRTLRLLVRLQAHVQLHGCDEQARQAAQDVMRYFDLAAPLHHEDEELHVFPVVLAGEDIALSATVKQLINQHRQMEVHWARLRDVLARLVARETPSQKPFEILQADAVDVFVSLYAEHIRMEEEVAYPAANNFLDVAKKSAMGADMMRRRGAKVSRNTDLGDRHGL
jgi:hemerythrin-like domain-containing protein